MNRKSLQIRLVALCAAVVLLSSSLAQAQNQNRQRRGRGGFGFTAARLAAAAPVQKELKLNDEQKAKIKEISDAASKRRRALFSNADNLSDEERQQKREESRKAGAADDKKVAEILNEEQNKRLQQVLLQLRGTAVLADKKVAKNLAITDEQKEKISKVLESYGKKRSELIQKVRNNSLSREEYGEKSGALRKDTEKEAMAVLNDGQKEKLAKMKGKTFDIRSLYTRRRPSA